MVETTKQSQQLAADCAQVLPQNHPTRLYSEAILGFISQEKLEFQRARQIFKALTDRTKDSVDPSIIQFYLMIVGRYAQCLVGCGNAMQSQKDLSQAIVRMQQISGPESPQLLNLKIVNAITIQKLGYKEQALQAFKQIREIQIKNDGIKSSSYQKTQMLLSYCMTELGQLDQAVEKITLLVDNIKKCNPQDKNLLIRVKLNLGITLFLQGKVEEAKQIDQQMKKYAEQNNLLFNDILHKMIQKSQQ